MSARDKFPPQLTADGSFTFFSVEFQEAYHSHFGAKQEAEVKFIKPCKIAEIAAKSNYLRLLDVCYGLGYNTAAALAAIWQINPQCFVESIALEIDSQIPRQAVDRQLLNDYPQPVPQLLAKLAATYQVRSSQLRARLLLGDARITIEEVLKCNFQADAIFLDPFSPPKCPQLWSVEFVAKVARCLHSRGKLATYSCAASVRTALSRCGLKFGSTVVGLGRRSPGTVASFNPTDLCPLSLQELEHLSTRAAIPYRDPLLCDTPAVIIARRQSEQQFSSLEPTTHWKKRWLDRLKH